MMSAIFRGETLCGRVIVQGEPNNASQTHLLRRRAFLLRAGGTAFGAVSVSLLAACSADHRTG